MSILVVGALALSGCDIIQEEIERAESIEFEDIKLDIENRDVYLKITSDADEQVIEEMEVNGESYELTSEGDDWYSIDDLPIEKAYEVSSVYYRTGIGMRLSFDYDHSVTLEEAVEYLPESNIHELDGDSLELGAYRFSPSEDSVALVGSDTQHELDKVSDWLTVILEDGNPEYVIFENDGVYVFEVPEQAEEYLK